MTNEQLVALIQAGDRDKLLPLWAQVQRMVLKQARRWAGHGGTAVEDLLQVGFIAMLRAVDTFNSERAKFSTWLFKYLQVEFTAACGCRTKRDMLDPIRTAVSLDAPLTDDDEDGTLGDILPDPGAEAAFLDVEHNELHDALETALNTLGPEEQRTIRARYLQGQTLAEIADDEGASRNTIHYREQRAMMKLRHPSRSKALAAFL